MKEMCTRAITLARHGALTRPVFGKPRGTRAVAAARRETVLDEVFDLETYLRVVREVSDTELRRAAVDVLGEFGDTSCVAVLGVILHTDACENTRRRASHALANIGGPEAEESLWRALESVEYPTDIREAALQDLLDLMTPDGWENYTFMNPTRVSLPADVRERLLRVSGLSEAVTYAVSTFDIAAEVPALMRDGNPAINREPVPCESDEHKFRPEVYDAAAGDTWIEDECCTLCGWSWSEIADHDRGDCCCPGDPRTKPLELARE